MSATYVDVVTGDEYPLDVQRWRSDKGNPLDVSALPGIGRADIDRSKRSLWRYAAALPIGVGEPIMLGEGRTPLVEADFAGVKALAKLEWFSPTGSFKDRGASVMLSILRQWGVREVLEDSSGNGGSAIAAYAAAGGLHARILAPALTQASKLTQMRAYGADLQLLDAARDEVGAAAIRMASEIYYASHSWHPLFLQGAKTLAYELWEDLGFEAPDNIVIPVGGGSNVLGCDIGFGELLRRGEIARLPRLFAVQPAHCAPMFQAQEFGDWTITPLPTIAEGASIAKPVRGPQVLDAVQRSGGRALAASEAEVVRAFHTLAAAGFYAEPTSALALAGLWQLHGLGIIGGDQRTVLVLTGGGNKAGDRIRSLLDGA